MLQIVAIVLAILIYMLNDMDMYTTAAALKLTPKNFIEANPVHDYLNDEKRALKERLKRIYQTKTIFGFLVFIFFFTFAINGVFLEHLVRLELLYVLGLAFVVWNNTSVLATRIQPKEGEKDGQ